MTTPTTEAPAPAPPARRDPSPWAGRPQLQGRETLFGYAMIAAALAVIIIFTLAPIVASVLLSLMSWDAISPPTFVGLENYDRLLHDQAVLRSFWVTIKLATIIVATQVVIGLSLALLVQRFRSTFLRGLFRTAFFLPLLVSAASISIVFTYLFNDKFGVVNYYLGLVGLSGVSWLGSEAGATATVIMVAVWQQLGFVFILFIAALSTMPKDVLEAVAIDGAGPIRTFFAVKLPLISPTVFFAAVIGLINALQLFDQPWVMTKGGPGDATRTTVIIIYQAAFQNLQFGYGSAISVVLFVLLMILTWLQFVAGRKWVFYS
ncbi:sugar ABC transporter permease [Actinopolymorpha sp. B17G11]|uniref:carbohydrate ABC transporter permease n=1 Tax=unclassified Actinopolymorpha TaxID=2627063 RepID=UPI0032D9599B